MKKLFVVLCAVLALTGVARADSLVASASWHNWTNASVNQDGTPFWDNHSYDGANCNVGYYIGNIAGCQAPNFYDLSPATNPDYLGTGSSNFVFAPDSSVSVTFVEALSAWNSPFGWYGADGVLHPLLDGNTFTPGGAYGFYLDSRNQSADGGGLWKTNIDPSHFTLFNEGGGSYLIGIEDMRAGDWDYQDVVVRVQSAPVPEPATLWLLGMGLLFVFRFVK